MDEVDAASQNVDEPCVGPKHRMSFLRVETKGAAIEFLLDAKTLLGLAMPPDETVPLENLTEQELFQRAMAERQQRAKPEVMTVRSMHPSKPRVDYVVTGRQSGRTYRVALRGLEAGSRIARAPISVPIIWEQKKRCHPCSEIA
ncbi:MAG: hypothetical protein D6753_03715 [Planctomycetota bacterium]|nr:MAG: hypothetical protein D6753_03715 [Planctomycetota bacterium]